MLPNCDISGASIAPWNVRARARRDGGFSAAAAKNLDVEIADLLAQGVAVDAEKVGGPNLVAARGRQRHRQQRMLDLAQHPVIEAGRRQGVAEAREIRREVPLDRG